MLKYYNQKLKGIKGVLPDIRGFSRTSDDGQLQSVIGIDNMLIYGAEQGVGDLVTSGEHSGKYKLPIILQGKNLFNESKNYDPRNERLVQSSWAYGEKLDGIYHIYSARQLTTVFLYKSGDYLTLDATKYTISADVYLDSKGGVNSKDVFVGVTSLVAIGAQTSLTVDTITAVPNYNNWYRISGTITVPEKRNTYMLFIQPKGSPSVWTGSCDLRIKNIQIEKGSQATGFEKYISPTTISNIYLDEPLRKVSSLSDYIDWKSRKAYYPASPLVHTDDVDLPDLKSIIPQYDKGYILSVGTAVKLQLSIKYRSNYQEV